MGGVVGGGFFFFKQKTAYEISACLVGSEMCIRDSCYGEDGYEYHCISHETVYTVPYKHFILTKQ